MLSFSVARNGKTIQIDCDHAGLGDLLATLEGLKRSATHVHLRSPKELSDKTPWGEPAVPEVIITIGGD